MITSLCILGRLRTTLYIDLLKRSHAVIEDLTIPVKMANTRTSLTSIVFLVVFASQATSQLVKPTDCGVGVGCFHDCGTTGCGFLVTWKDKGDGSIDFEIKVTLATLSEKWFAIGFSADRSMDVASVTECTIENTQGPNYGGVYHSYNAGYHTNSRLTGADKTLGLTLTSDDHISGVYTCRFNQVKNPSGASSQIFDLNTNWYILYAQGPLDTGGNKIQHSSSPFMSQDAIDLSGTVDMSINGPIQPPTQLIQKDANCGTSLGCFHDCDQTDHCTFLISWTDSATSVDFVIKAAVEFKSKQWFAIGFSNDAIMKDDSVTECVIDNPSGITAQVYHSYNAVYGNTNSRLTNGNENLGLTLNEVSYQNGVVTCGFKQEKNPATAPAEIFDLNSNWYLMYAYGDVNAAGVKLEHNLTPGPKTTTERVDFSQKMDIQANIPTQLAHDVNCGVSEGCFHDCNDAGQGCTFHISWEVKGDEIEFKIKAVLKSTAPQWFAIGLSEDTKMGSDSVSECIMKPDTVEVYHSWNTPVGDENEALPTHVKEDKYFMCEFYLKKTPSNAPPEIFSLTENWYILYAYGDMNGDVKLQHSLTPGPSSTQEKVNFAQFQDLRDVHVLAHDPDCGVSEGCFHNCDESGQGCTFHISWEVKGDEIEFKIKAVLKSTAPQWFAIGLSDDTKMGSDSVTECIMKADSVEVHRSWNEGISNSRIQDNQLGVRLEKYVKEEKYFMCEFYQQITVANAPAQIRNLTENWYILYAHGNMNGDSKLEHSLTPGPSSTQEKVNFSQFQDLRDTHVLALDADCGVSEGCFHDCDESGQGCTFHISWEVKGAEIEFKIKAVLTSTEPQWFAIGLSTDSLMGSDSVTECIMKADSVEVHRSWNEGISNSRIGDNKLGVRLQKYVKEEKYFMCEFYQQITLSNAPAQIKSLAENWYILYAHGNMNGDSKSRHSLTPGPVATTEKVNFTQVQVFKPVQTHELVKDAGCGTTEGCFHDCDGTGHGCTFLVSWEKKGDEIEFKIKAVLTSTAPQWFAIGLSDDDKMGSDSVSECIMKSDGVDVYHSWNKDDHTNQDIPASKSLGIRYEKHVKEDKYFMCEFYLKKTPSNAPPEIFSLTENWYILYAHGDMNGDQKARHSTKPIATSAKVDFVDTVYQTFAAAGQTQNALLDSGCGTSIGCYHNCQSGGPCTFLVSWKDTGDSIDFNIKAKQATSAVDRWFAVGFSNDRDMGSDSVTDCILKSDKTVTVYHSWNNDKDNSRLAEPDATLGLSLTANTFENGVFSCSFKREKKPKNDTSRIFDLNDDFHVMFASGDMKGATEKSRHSPTPVASVGKVDFQKIVNVAAPAAVLEVTKKVHAIFMMLGMVFSASIGIVIARFYKPIWKGHQIGGKDVWFQVHRFIMCSAVLFAAVGFITIFVDEGRWVEIDGTKFQQAHPFCGTAAMALFVINPVMAIFRCTPDDDNRKYFNWCHWFVGTSGHILGVLTIFMGLGMDDVGVPEYTLWIMIAYVAYQFLIELILQFHHCCVEGTGGNSRAEAYELKGPRGSSTDVPSDSALTKGSGFKRAVIYIHVFIIAGFTIAVSVIIGIQ
ncbi:hypothetical protein ScPMuIL_001226 [Solemya velum]